MLHRWLQTANPQKQYPAPYPGLPDPNKEATPEEAATTASVNELVLEQCIPPSTPRKRKREVFNDYTDETRLKVARYALETSATRAARRYSEELGRKLNESTVRGWVTKYKGQVKQLRRELTSDDMTPAKRGPAPLLGRLDSLVQQQLRKMRDAGSVVNKSITISTALGIVQHHQRTMLPEYGGHVQLTRTWAASLMSRMGYVRRKGTKAARQLPADFPEVKATFLERVRSAVTAHDIPPQLVINFDQTGVNVVPVSSWTMHSEGAKQVEIFGKEDKRQITVLLGTTLAGQLLPPQVVYQGKTDACHPRYTFPPEWNVTHSENHWSTIEKMEEFLTKILLPFVDKQRDALDPLSASRHW